MKLKRLLRGRSVEQYTPDRRGFISALGAMSVHYQTSSSLLPDHPSEHFVIPQGFSAHRVISWGDRLQDGGTLTFPIQSVEDQLNAFGYNNDFIAFHPLDDDKQGKSRHQRGLLSVNHEYSNPSLMTPSVGHDSGAQLNAEQLKIDMAAVGHSVIEVSRRSGRWGVTWGSRYHRRLSALGPMIDLSGPASGHRRLKTSKDPTGTKVLGTFSNCAGGMTPWGTTLIAEENVNQGFYGSLRGPEAEQLRRMDFAERAPRMNWYQVDPRFNFDLEPHEPNRFGWVVELDPRDPTKAPVKRTALGRFKHECASCTLSSEGRVVVYSGDDQEGEFLYRFVSDQVYHPERPETGWGLLDHGILSVAQFQANGQVNWLPLVWGEGPLNETQGFHDQGDVLIETRRAASLVGATPLDRPEDVEICPRTNRVYVMLTQSKHRQGVTPACERAPNPHGHIIELTPPLGDHASQHMAWTPLVLAGPSSEGGSQTGGGWLRNPDNGAFSPSGDLYVAADVKATPKSHFANGLWRCPTSGDQRGQAIRICSAPVGSELTGLTFTPDGKTLFVSVQHPGEGSSWQAPSTRWPDFRSDRPPRPTLLAIEREDGNAI